MHPLLDRLKDRKIVQWGLAYLAGAWVVLQLADGLGARWNWPPGFQRSIDILLVIGLLATLVLAWYHGEQGRQHVSGMELLILATVLLLGGGGLALLNRQGGEAGAAGAGLESGGSNAASSEPLDPKRIAVLPFEHRSANDDDRFLTEGIQDDLLSQLAKVQDLSVISRTSAERYAGTTMGILEIARELGAGTIIEGGVQRAGQALRINVQVIDGRSDDHLWAETFNSAFTMDNLFSVQGAVVAQVALAVSATLLPKEEELISTPPTANAEAYELYKRARYLWRSSATDRYQEAIDLYERAVALDPTFALAWVGLSDALADLAGTERSEELVPRALDAAQQALSLNPDLGEAHGALAYVAHVFDWDTASARDHFLKAVELSPSNTTALHDFGRFLYNFGDIDESVSYLIRARELDPNIPYIAWSLARALTESGRPEEGLRAVEESLLLQPTSYGHGTAAYALYRLGRHAEAVERAELATVDDDVFAVLNLARLAEIQALTGDAESAQRSLASSKGQLAVSSARAAPVEIAWAHVALQESDSAFAWFYRALEARERNLLERKLWSDWANPIRNDPRYSDLLEQIDLGGAGPTTP